MTGDHSKHLTVLTSIVLSLTRLLSTVSENQAALAKQIEKLDDKKKAAGRLYKKIKKTELNLASLEQLVDRLDRELKSSELN